jgi:hypothetical protein
VLLLHYLKEGEDVRLIFPVYNTHHIPSETTYAPSSSLFLIRGTTRPTTHSISDIDQEQNNRRTQKLF